MQDKVLQMAYSPLVQDQLKKVYASKKKKRKKKEYQDVRRDINSLNIKNVLVR